MSAKRTAAGEDLRTGAAATPRVSYLIGRLHRVLVIRLRAILAEEGLSIPEYTTLSVLRIQDGLSNAQLARRSLITPQSMNEALSRLSERGLIRRAPHPSHGRIIRTELSDAGRETLARCDQGVDQFEAEMLSGLSVRKVEAFRAALTVTSRDLERSVTAQTGDSSRAVEPQSS